MSKVSEGDKTLQPLDKVGTETLIALLSTNTRTEASARLGISRNALYERIDKYGLEEHIAKIPEQALSVMKQGSIKAAENFITKIDSRNENISLEASREVLDRVGVKQQAVNNTNVQVNFQQFIQKEKNEFGI